MTSIQILQTLLEITIYSAVLFACIMVFKAINKGKLSATLSFVLWFLLIVRLCVPVTVQSAFHLFTLPQEQQQAAAAPIASTLPQGLTVPQSTTPQVEPVQQTELQTSATYQAVQTAPQQTALPALTVYDWLVLLWLCGACAFGGWTIGLSCRITKMIKRQSVPAPAEIEKLYEACRAEMGIKKKPPLLITLNLLSPALVVSARPTILLPYAFVKQARQEQIRLALCHELVHYKRRDHWLCMLLRVLSVLYWFNPVLWLAEKEIAADMETACDNRIVKGMQKEEKAYYANTILCMFSARTQTPFVLGLALPSTKQIAEKRIRGIYMKSKTKSSIKLAAILLAMVLLVSCFTTACQPAQAEEPTSAPPAASSDAQAVQAIASASPIAVQSAQPTTTADNKYKQTNKLNDLVTINYNADVVQPQGNIPVAAMKIRDFNEADVQKVADYFFAGQPAYAPWTRTKTDIQNEIADLQQDAKNIDATRVKYIADHPWAADVYQSLLDNNGTLTDAAWNKVKDKYSLTTADQEVFMDACGRTQSVKQDSTYIKKDQEEIKTAPDTEEKKPSALKFQNIKIGNQVYNQEKAWSQKADGTISEVQGTKSNDKVSSDIIYNSKVINNKYAPPDMYERKPFNIAQNQAQKLAEQAVAAICPYLSLAGCSIDKDPIVLDTGEISQYDSCYVFNFTRQVAGVPITYDSYGGYEYADSLDWNNLKLISYEDIEVRVDDGGIRYLQWRAPYSDIQITSLRNACTVSMDEAKQKFEDNIRSQLPEDKYAAQNNQSPYKIDTITININKIQLGLTRVQDKAGNFTLVPTWDFFGEATAYKKGQEVIGNRFGQSQGNDSFYTVNALDGTEISRSAQAQGW